MMQEKEPMYHARDEPGRAGASVHGGRGEQELERGTPLKAPPLKKKKGS